MRKLLLLVLLGFLGAVLCGGCSPSYNDLKDPLKPTSAVDQATPKVDPSSPASTAYPANQPDSAVTPTVRSGLEASDPATFSIASGDLQLVEFFAFW